MSIKIILEWETCPRCVHVVLDVSLAISSPPRRHRIDLWPNPQSFTNISIRYISLEPCLAVVIPIDIA
jgi:hypothetical protein